VEVEQEQMIERQEHFRRLEQMYLGAPVNDFYQPKIRIEEARAEVSFSVRPDMMHAASAVHGSVYFKVLDDACFFAANSLVEDVFVLTANFNIYLTRPMKEGVIRGVGRVVHRAGRMFLAEGEVFDGQGRSIARGSGNFVRSAIKLDEAVGYL
jgi:uncharacterized protein (TIGR00369 family)